jgi:SAM-dependent methyltransferase
VTQSATPQADSGPRKWPKVLPPLSAEQTRVHDDFMKQWHEIVPKRYRAIEHFNHTFPVSHSHPGFRATLEIGAGLGEHLNYEVLSSEQEQDYCALELRENMAAQIRATHPHVKTIVGDCQQRLPFEDNHFDRYLAVHVLEHLPDLPACIREAWRLLNKEHGQLLVVIPCEGGLAYSFARRISAQRIFERTYRMPYGPFITREHLNRPAEILAELKPYFTIEARRFFPFPFARLVAPNLCIGLALSPRQTPADARSAD